MKDGDTATFLLESLRIDADHYTLQAWPIRVAALNTAETHGPHPAEAAAARDALAALLAGAEEIRVEPIGKMTFERAVGRVWMRRDGEWADAADVMRAAGYAVPQGD